MGAIVQFENALTSVGNGLFPTYALLNHSCDNNVSKYFVGPVMVAEASKHIRAGEEVTDNYFPPAMVMPREERRDWLSSHYMFHCCCNACAIDQPNIRNMTTEPTVLLCPSCKSKLNAGRTTDIMTCTNCGTGVDIKILKRCVEETWKALEQGAEQLQSWRSAKELEEGYISYTYRYSQLLDLVCHPCRLLYKAEQYFWKAQRRARGNK